MDRIDIVITMGGLGSRFRKAGYNMPKYMIEAKGRTLFDWSMISLEGYRSCVDRYVFIAMRDEGSDVSAFIDAHCRALGIDRFHVILLDYLTDGQATTAMLAEKYWNSEHALLIYNIDTYVESGQMNASELRGDGFIPCFQAPGDHWSFVRLGEDGAAVEIREKQRISEYCTLGAYYFRSCQLYSEMYREYYDNGGEGLCGEKYVAPIYNYMLGRGMKIYISDVAPEYVHVLGTPEELQTFIES